MRVWLLLLTFTAAAYAQQAEPERVVVTQQDLIDMTESRLPVSLILKTVRAAHVVPTLGPQDLISLTRLGVSSEVLEAVVERSGGGPRPSTDPLPRGERNPIPSAEPSEEPPDSGAGQESRFRLTASLNVRRGWGGSPFSSDKRPFAVYWALTALDDRGSPIPLRGCPREPICWCGDPLGRKRCANPGAAEWDSFLSCLRAVEMTPGQAVDLFDLEIPGEVRELRATPFVGVLAKDDSMYLEPWTSESVGPAYVSVRPEPGQAYEAEIQTELTAGRKPNLVLGQESFRLRDATQRPLADAIALRPASGVDMTPASLQPCVVD